MSVTLSEVKRAARAHRAPLAGESAGYLVLAIADQVLKAPRLVQAADIELTEDGALRVASGHASSDVDAELALRQALDQLLLVASSGSAALTRASRRTAPLGLSALVRELEAALIPVNRSAARRALARVHRETARALQSGSLPEDVDLPCSAPPAQPALAAPAESAAVVAPAVAEALPESVPVAAPAVAEALPESAPEVAAPAAAEALAESVSLAPPAGPLAVEAREPQLEPEPEPDLDQDLETPARCASVLPALAATESRLDGVLSALCEELPAPPQFVESDALTSALAVRTVSVCAPPVVPVAAEPEPEFWIDIEFETDAGEFETDAVDSGAAPTVMRAVAVEPVALSGDEATGQTPLLDLLEVEARTRPEPVVLRNALRPLLDLLQKPMPEAEALHEPVPETPTLGALATHLPILEPEQIAEMSIAASLSAELLQSSRARGRRRGDDEPAEPVPELPPLSPAVALVESKKSDLNELVANFQVAEPNINRGLCRAIKELADLDATPAPFAALIR